ncbi:hypothetical protein MTR_3g072005 [Medicago truncatula]|uniref:Transmembrane protein n=1 Tax=Medicago truncatula TaxID=3880 RepID=A0A072UZF7_MEDTR|nr:hypothetical protein MTR_3g072005 [Medicago truncatula]
MVFLGLKARILAALCLDQVLLSKANQWISKHVCLKQASAHLVHHHRQCILTRNMSSLQHHFVQSKLPRSTSFTSHKANTLKYHLVGAHKCNAV